MIFDRTFAMWRLPGESAVHLAEGPELTDGSARFVVKPWGECGDTPTESTDHDQYIDAIADLTRRLRLRGGKMVISRTTVVGTPDTDWLEVFSRLADSAPNAFVFLYNTPETGAWIGASPELLLRTDDGLNVHTMALAGTRPAGTIEPWDQKNITEQAIVREYIEGVFLKHCSNVTSSDTLSLKAHCVEHLCTPISGTLADDFSALLADLHPTPAICGYPKDEARADIDRIEKHLRGCYSGYVGVEDGQRRDFFVNLRCARIAPDRACIYTGGGITPDSDPETEWLETCAKASQLIQAINKPSNP